LIGILAILSDFEFWFISIIKRMILDRIHIASLWSRWIAFLNYLLRVYFSNQVDLVLVVWFHYALLLIWKNLRQIGVWIINFHYLIIVDLLFIYFRFVKILVKIVLSRAFIYVWMVSHCFWFWILTVIRGSLSYSFGWWLIVWLDLCIILVWLISTHFS